MHVPRLFVALLVLACLSDALRSKSPNKKHPRHEKHEQEEHEREESVPMIPRTHVPMPPDFEDYTRGHKPLMVFPGAASIPGKRRREECPGDQLPCFDPADPNSSAETWTFATPRDRVGAACAPGGKGGVGHYFYNVWVPEVVPFVVPPGTPGRKDAAVLVAPGGGNMHLAWEPDAVAACEWLNAQGISAFLLKYRLPNADIPVLDAQRAMSLIRSKAVEYGLNASRIGFFGGSAGGVLGIRLGCSVKRGYPRIDPVDDFDFRPNFLMLLYPATPLPKEWIGSLSLSLLPPSFVAFAANDRCASAGSIRLFCMAANKQPHSPVEQHEFPDGGHGFGFPEFWPTLAPTASQRPWRRQAVEWMQRIGML